MELPIVSRDHYNEMKWMLEDRLDDLQKRFDALQARADDLAASVLAADKDEPEVRDEPISFTPTISQVRNAANGWAAQRAKEGKKA